MNLSKFKRMNPYYFMLIWFFGSILITVLLMIVTGLNTPGGRQIPMTILSYAVYVIPIGIILICSIAPFINYNWFEKNWYIDLFILIIFLIPIYIGLK